MKQRWDWQCPKCYSENSTSTLLESKYEYSTYFNEEIPLSIVEFTCLDCREKWIEIIQKINIDKVNIN